MGLLYMADPVGCQHKTTFPAEAKALPSEATSAIVSGSELCLDACNMLMGCILFLDTLVHQAMHVPIHSPCITITRRGLSCMLLI